MCLYITYIKKNVQVLQGLSSPCCSFMTMLKLKGGNLGNVQLLLTDWAVWLSGDPPKKRGRGRPRKTEALVRRAVEVKKEEPAEEEEDDIVDAGAIDDPEGWFCDTEYLKKKKKASGRWEVIWSEKI